MSTQTGEFQTSSSWKSSSWGFEPAHSQSQRQLGSPAPHPVWRRKASVRQSTSSRPDLRRDLRSRARRERPVLLLLWELTGDTSPIQKGLLPANLQSQLRSRLEPTLGRLLLKLQQQIHHRSISDPSHPGRCFTHLTTPPPRPLPL